ncbi:MAG: ABC transporter, ATP-binding protein (cluster 1, maltose/g3p/polyamine/iron); ABC transporter, ATP-binding protein (cluster 10, nitrate/sulfonate/bicarbonate) [uncultured Paraburkholderia sp.]|nr:MAG: ABC transporter, ATP-binding protein (cluster 1, maltose/g3p/polyamine/iron); ABC transporter, ATP-binding protein (cluster 10, nitrate/sulfonate/bicarbonate) [uncultured Paraburkholderia sp.]
MITGLLKPTTGEVRVMGAPVDGIDPRIGFVFQADAVFPWRSVIDNVAAGPLYRGRSKSAAYDEANEWLRRVGLDKFGKHYPHQLSGDMRKRVALAQTFINRPEIVMVFFVVFANAFQGVRKADRYMIANAQILGASRRQVTTSVVIPSALSWILASLHVSFGFALVGAVVGEFLGSKQGIGLLISTAQGAFNASGVFAAMIVLAVVALAADYLLTAVEQRLLKWRPAAM